MGNASIQLAVTNVNAEEVLLEEIAKLVCIKSLIT